MLGRRFLLLIHTGRRTGKTYETVLEVAGYDRSASEVTIGSGWGAGADWYRNLEVSGTAEVIIGTGRFLATPRVLDQQEAVRAVVDYERRNRLIMPIERAVLSRLAGWRYDGSEESRQRLVQQLPIIALRLTPQ
jgi:deazaflavin-dependent oxidoreductase (nitroreductase family)